MFNEKEQQLRFDDLQSELEEMKEREKQIYRELGRPYYEVDVHDVLQYAESKQGTRYVDEWQEGRDSAFAEIEAYIESSKTKEEK